MPKLIFSLEDGYIGSDAQDNGTSSSASDKQMQLKEDDGDD